MKTINEYLEDQKELSLTMWKTELEKYAPSKVLANYYQMRVLILKHLIKEYETTEKAQTNC